MLFAPYDDQEKYELRLNPDRPINYVPEPGDDPRSVESAMDTMRLWDYLLAHGNDQLVNAGTIAQELGWPRAAVLHYSTFLLMGGFVECDRGRELMKAIDRIGPAIKSWLVEHGYKPIL